MVWMKGHAMKTRTATFLAAILASLLLPHYAHGASGYDVSDLWWNPGESGWGISLVQQRDVVFATLLVYDSVRRPTWYAATLSFEGLTPQTREVNYAGPLYETEGPWFGGAFSPAAVAVRQVGTMQLRSPDLVHATLTYTVGAQEVRKEIERQTLRVDDYAGSYDGSFVMTNTRCDNPANDGTRTTRATLQIAQSPGSMSLTVAGDGVTCSYSGPYTQNGRLGSVFSNFNCTNGQVGALVFEEMNVQRFGVMGLVFGTDNRGCHIEGRFAAAKP